MTTRLTCTPTTMNKGLMNLVYGRYELESRTIGQEWRL